MKRSLIALQKMTRSTIISVPMNLGQPNIGLDRAPLQMIDGGLPQLLQNVGWKVTQSPPVVIDSLIRNNSPNKMMSEINAKNCLEVGIASELIHNEVSQHCTEGNFPLILGGDHSIAIGTISGIKSKRKNTAVVWVDAHGDINTPSGSNSGNMHGMPVAFLMGLVENASSLPGFGWFKPCLDPQDLVYIGLRDLDPFEKVTIRKLGIKAFTMHDVDRKGIGRVMEETLAHLGDKDIHLSFDIDGIDPFVAPHTGTAVTGGLTFREANYICEAISLTGRLTSMEVVEVNPALRQEIDPAQTVNVALTIIGSAMGQTLL